MFSIKFGGNDILPNEDLYAGLGSALLADQVDETFITRMSRVASPMGSLRDRWYIRPRWVDGVFLQGRSGPER